MGIEDKLIKMKRQIEEAKTQAAQAQGALNQLLDQLKREFGVKDLKEAEKLLTELEAKEQELEQELEDKIVHLEESYEWR